MAAGLLLLGGLTFAAALSRSPDVALASRDQPTSLTSSKGACRRVRAPKPRVEHLRRPPQTVRRSDHLVAKVKTNCGRFEIRLDARRSPATVNSFVFLARSGFYDGLQFYRVVPHFVIQGGDPSGSGMGGPGYHITEPPPRHYHYAPGTVAMGRAYDEPRGRSGSNFFIVLPGAGRIAPAYAVLGRVQRGMKVIRRIGTLGSPSEKPSQTVRIDWVRIRRQ